MNSLPKTVTRQRRDCDMNPGSSALESSTLTTQCYYTEKWQLSMVLTEVMLAITNTATSH